MEKHGGAILDSEVSGGLLLSGVDSTQLGKEWIGSEDMNPRRAAHDHLYTFDETSALTRSIEVNEYRTSPDRLAFELIMLLYREYGLDGEDVPFFSASTGRFQLG